MRPELGGRYRVKMQDCCIAGTFEARVVAMTADNEFVYAVGFDNGVNLTELNGVTFEPAERPQD